jgi:hypothetical protein
MISVKYYAKDRNTGMIVSSGKYYFQEDNKYTMDNIEDNRKFIQDTLGNHTVIAVIEIVKENT